MLALLAASRELRPTLAKLMGVEIFSEAQLATLVSLQSLDPVGATAALLSQHAGVSPAHLTLVIDSLVARDLVAEGSSPGNRQQRSIRLTSKGRNATVLTIHLFLEATNELLGGLTPAERLVLEQASRKLTERARQLRA